MDESHVEQANVLLRRQIGDGAEDCETIKSFIKQPNGVALVAISDNNEVTGVLLAGESVTRAHIHRLVISPKNRMGGIGRALVEKALLIFSENPSLKMCFVRTYGDALNTTGAFFLKCGFKLSSRPDGECVIDAFTFYLPFKHS
jgi:ribosomal protein S18 acetylase RimI-like enzyme